MLGRMERLEINRENLETQQTLKPPKSEEPPLEKNTCVLQAEQVKAEKSEKAEGGKESCSVS